MFGRAAAVNRNQRGFTFIEMLVALTIASLIGVGVTTAITQTLNTSVRNSDHTVAVKQVQNAIYWVRRDAKMAQTVQVDEGDSGLPLTLTWVEWDNTQHQITYVVEEGKLKRRHSIDGGEPTTLLVAEYINPDPALTNCEFTVGVLTFKVTTTVGSGSLATEETQVFRVDPRSN